MTNSGESNKLIAVLKVLEKYDLVDNTGHINNCGYPDCECAKLGEDIYQAISWNLDTAPLVQLELAIHDADCPGHDSSFEGHGDKYTKMALAAISVFPPEREPYWLRDRKLVQETSLNLIIDRLDKLSSKD